MNLPYILKYWKVGLAFNGWKLSGLFFKTGITIFHHFISQNKHLQKYDQIFPILQKILLFKKHQGINKNHKASKNSISNLISIWSGIQTYTNLDLSKFHKSYDIVSIPTFFRFFRNFSEPPILRAAAINFRQGSPLRPRCRLFSVKCRWGRGLAGLTY